MIPALRALDHEIVAVCSSSTARGAAFAAEHGISAAYDDLAAFLANPAVEAVYVSSTNELHESQTVAAARAGKHVLCEKPLALELAPARRMLAAAREANVVLAVNHHFRNGTWNRAAREAIAGGAIGRPLSARVSQAFLLPEQLRGWRLRATARGAGAILDLTVHTADTLRFVLDAEIEQVVAVGARQAFGGEGAEDVAMGVMRLSDGVLASFHDAFNVRGARSSLEVHGTEGSIVIDDALDERLVARAVLWRDGVERPLPFDPPEDLYVHGLRRFASAVAGRGTPAATGEDGLRSLAAALAVRTAASSGRATAVEPCSARPRLAASLTPCPHAAPAPRCPSPPSRP